VQKLLAYCKLDALRKVFFRPKWRFFFGDSFLSDTSMGVAGFRLYAEPASSLSMFGACRAYWQALWLCLVHGMPYAQLCECYPGFEPQARCAIISLCCPVDAAAATALA